MPCEEFQKISCMMGGNQGDMYSGNMHQNATGNLVSLQQSQSQSQQQQHQNHSKQVFNGFHTSPCFEVPKIETNLMNPIFFNSKLPPLRVDSEDGDALLVKYQQGQKRSSQGFTSGYHYLNNRPLPTLFNSIGRPFVQSENNQKSMYYTNLTRSQSFPVLESILNQSLDFVDNKQDQEQLNKKRQHQQSLQEDYGGDDQNYFQRSGGIDQIIDSNHRNMLLGFSNREMMMFNIEDSHPPFSNPMLRQPQPPQNQYLQNQQHQQNPKCLDQRIGQQPLYTPPLPQPQPSHPVQAPRPRQNNGYFHLQTQQNTNVVIYKIQLIYSQSSRRYRQPFSIVGSKDMTFSSFINKFRELANFSVNSQFNLFVEKEQGTKNLVPLISMDQLTLTKANFIRIMQSNNQSNSPATYQAQNQSQSSSLVCRKNNSSQQVLAKKINKKKKIKESIAITKLTNAEEQASKRKQMKFF